MAHRFDVRIVGSSFENDAAREAALHDSVHEAGLGQIVRFEPFQEDATPLYQWADVVIVPSRRPESLGRVAIEALAFGRPALVAAIGGLPEIVDDGVNGWIVPANDAPALGRKLAELVRGPVDWAALSTAARLRYEAAFTDRGVARQIQDIVATRLAANGHERRHVST
jgi:glycosyltransferase involved in cell wall biosynthesis